MEKEYIRVNAPPGVSDRTITMLSLASKYTGSEIRTYIQTHHPEIPPSLYPGVKAKSFRPSLVSDMAGFTAKEVLFILLNAPDTTVATSVTTFNWSDVAEGLGYTQTVVNKVTKDDDIGETMRIGITKEDFPFENPRGYVKFEDIGGHFFYCPIRGQFLDTNYFRDQRISKSIYNQCLVETVAMLSTLFYFKNGSVIPIQATEAGAKLLNFDGLLSKKYNNMLGYTSVTLSEWIKNTACPEPRGWEATTLHGNKFAHAVYLALAQQLKNPSNNVIHELSILSQLINTSNGRPFLDISAGLAVSGGVINLPTSLEGIGLNLMDKDASLSQAYCALHLARGFRGENKGEKGSLSRVAYFGCNISANIAEISYLSSNLSRWVRDDYDIICLPNDSGSSGGMLAVLNALAVLDYKGTVIMQDSPAIRASVTPLIGDARPDTLDMWFKFGRASFKLMLVSSSYVYCGESYIDKAKKMYRPTRAMVLDMRILLTGSYNYTNFVSNDAQLRQAFDGRVREWQGWRFPVLSRVHIFSDITDFASDELQIVTGVELHNLVAWISYKMPLEESKDDWWYTLKNPGDLRVVAAASIVANIGRCTRLLTRVSVRLLMTSLKYKYPSIRLRGLGKVNNRAIIYQRLNIEEAMTRGSADVLRLFREGDTVTRSILLSDERTVALIGGQAMKELAGQITATPAVVESPPAQTAFIPMTLTDDEILGEADET